MSPKFLRFNGGTIARALHVGGSEGIRLLGSVTPAALPTVTRAAILIPNERTTANLRQWGLIGYQTGQDTLELHADPNSQVAAGAANVALKCRGNAVFKVSVDNGGTKKLAFFGATLAGKANVVGAKAGNVALTNLLAALATIGLLSDNTT